MKKPHELGLFLFNLSRSEGMEFIFALLRAGFRISRIGLRFKELRKFTRLEKSTLTEKFSVFYLKLLRKPPRKLFGNSLLFPIKSFNLTITFSIRNQI